MNSFNIMPQNLANISARKQSLESIIDQATRELNAIQMQQYPANLTQNFQIAPTQFGNVIKIVDSFDDINKEIVLQDTYFASKDFKNFWIKNTKGEIRSFELKEIIEKDQKDILIENLQNQINELKRSMNNGYNKFNGPNGHSENDERFISEKSSNVQSNSTGVSKKRGS